MLDIINADLIIGQAAVKTAQSALRIIQIHHRFWPELGLQLKGHIQVERPQDLLGKVPVAVIPRQLIGGIQRFAAGGRRCRARRIVIAA